MVSGISAQFPEVALEARDDLSVLRGSDAQRPQES